MGGGHASTAIESRASREHTHRGSQCRIIVSDNHSQKAPYDIRINDQPSSQCFLFFLFRVMPRTAIATLSITVCTRTIIMPIIVPIGLASDNPPAIPRHFTTDITEQLSTQRNDFQTSFRICFPLTSQPFFTLLVFFSGICFFSWRLFCLKSQFPWHDTQLTPLAATRFITFPPSVETSGICSSYLQISIGSVPLFEGQTNQPEQPTKTSILSNQDVQ